MLGKIFIRIESNINAEFNKNLFNFRYLKAEFTPPEFKKIINSLNLFFLIKYSGKFSSNFFLFLNNNFAIEVFDNQGSSGKKRFYY